MPRLLTSVIPNNGYFSHTIRCRSAGRWWGLARSLLILLSPSFPTPRFPPRRAEASGSRPRMRPPDTDDRPHDFSPNNTHKGGYIIKFSFYSLFVNHSVLLLDLFRPFCCCQALLDIVKWNKVKRRHVIFYFE